MSKIRERIYVESGLEPEFFICGEIKTEDAGGGNIRVMHYAHKRGDLVLQFTEVVPLGFLRHYAAALSASPRIHEQDGNIWGEATVN